MWKVFDESGDRMKKISKLLFLGITILLTSCGVTKQYDNTTVEIMNFYKGFYSSLGFAYFTKPEQLIQVANYSEIYNDRYIKYEYYLSNDYDEVKEIFENSVNMSFNIFFKEDVFTDNYIMIFYEKTNRNKYFRDISIENDEIKMKYSVVSDQLPGTYASLLVFITIPKELIEGKYNKDITYKMYLDSGWGIE